MLRLQDFSIPAGGSVRVDMALSYVYLQTLTGAAGVLNVSMPTGGEVVPLLPGQGINLPPNEPVAGVVLRNPNASTITGTVLLGSGRFEDRRVTGSVDILDNVAGSCTTDFVASAGALAFASQTILAAASNTAGLIVRAVALIGVAGAGGITRGKVLASPTTPASFNPAVSAQTVLLGIMYSTGSADKSVFSATDTRRRIPAGWGLFFTSDSTVAAPSINQANVSYELL